MIFAKPIVGKVARGEATLTIRPATARPPAHGARRCVKPPDVIEDGKRRTGTIACHIIIVDVREMLAGGVTFKQARACGYRTTDAFKASWVEIHDAQWLKAWSERHNVDGFSEGFLLERFNAKHARTPCYAITFKLAVDIPRYLADQRVAHHNEDGQYTASPHRAIDDLEAVPAQYQEKLSKDALGFCIGRQRERAREQREQRSESKKPRLEMFKRAA